MNERDKELAKQVTWYADVTLTELSRYADLIRADEREACAVIADSMDSLQDGEIGKAIRARRNT